MEKEIIEKIASLPTKQALELLATCENVIHDKLKQELTKVELQLKDLDAYRNRHNQKTNY